MLSISFIMSETTDKSPKAIGFHDFMQDKDRSALDKYQELVLGEHGMFQLLRYETLTFLLSNTPGLLGLFLRQKLYRGMFGHLGERVIIGTGVSLRLPKHIDIHRSCVIEDLASLTVRGDASSGIVLGDGVFVGRGTVIYARFGKINIAKHATISSHCRIATANGTVSIGQYVQIAAFCYVGGSDHHFSRLDVPMALQGSKAKGGVTIEDDVWVGAHTFVKDGVTIGRGSIIGACSFVNSDIPPYSLAYGCPAKIRGQRIEERDSKVSLGAQ